MIDLQGMEKSRPSLHDDRGRVAIDVQTMISFWLNPLHNAFSDFSLHTGQFLTIYKFYRE